MSVSAGDAIVVLDRMAKYVRQRLNEKELAQRKRYWQTAKQLEENGLLEDFLLFYYKDLSNDFYSFRDWQYAIAVPQRWRVRTQVDDALGPLEDHEEKPVYEEEKLGKIILRGWSQHILQVSEGEAKDQSSLWQKGPDKEWLRKYLYQSETFALKSIDAGQDGIKMSCYPSDYFSFVSTCEYLSYELVEQFAKHGAAKEQFSELILEARDKSAKGDAIYQFERRSAKVGVNIFLVGQYNNRPHCILTRRAEDLVEFPGRYSVVPAGSFEPRGPERRQWYFLSLTCLLELAEECFLGLPNIEEPKKILPSWIEEEYPFLKKVRDSLEKGESQLMFTALGVDLLTAKPEVCGVLYLGDDLMLEILKGKLNFETQNAYLRELDDKDLLDKIRPGKVAPAGAVAILEGLKFCESCLKADTVLSNPPRSHVP